MEQIQNVHELLYEYLLALKIDVREFEKYSNCTLTNKIFTVPKPAAFQFITHFLFNKLDSGKCLEVFRHLWPPHTTKNSSDFNKAASNWLSTLGQECPEIGLPKNPNVLFMSPYGEKLCSVYLSFARFVLQKSIKQKNKVQILKTPSLNAKNKVAVLNVHTAMYRKLLHRYEEIENISIDVRNKLSVGAESLVTTNTNLKQNIKDVEFLLKEKNKEIVDLFETEDLTDAENKLVNSNREILDWLSKSWQKIHEIHQAIQPAKKILDSDYIAMDRMVIDGNQYPVKIPPSLILQIETVLEKENLFRIHNNGKLNFETLVKFFTIVLSTFEEPLKELSRIFSTDQVSSAHASLDNEVKKSLENIKVKKQETIESLNASLKEHERQLSTSNNNNPKKYTINGRRYSLQQATSNTHVTLTNNSMLDDSVNVNLMNLSAVSLFETSDSDNMSSPDLCQKILNSSMKIGSKQQLPSICVPSPETFENGTPDLPKPNLDRSRLKTQMKKPARRSWSNDKITISSNSMLHTLDKNKNATFCTPPEKRKYSFDAANFPVHFEDLVLSPSLNNSYAASLISGDSFNISLLDAQTLPECPEFDLTSELEASNFLLELSD